MSILVTGSLRGVSASADSMQLHASNQSVTFPGDVTVSGTLTAAAGLYSSWAHVYELAASAGDDGGTFSSGAMRTRTLNQEEDPDGIVSISSNQFTLAAGTYRITWNAPAFQCGAHTSQLYNVTDTSVAIRGSIAESHAGADNAQTSSFGIGRITIGGSKAFEVQHQCATTRNDDGFGYAMGGQTYKFTTVEILKEA